MTAGFSASEKETVANKRDIFVGLIKSHVSEGVFQDPRTNLGHYIS